VILNLSPRLVLLLTGAALTAGCRGCDAGVPSPPAPAARLMLQPPRLDLGRLVQDQEARATAVIRNQGSALLQIDAVDASRFCSGRVEPGTIPPGGSATLVVSCRSDLYGPLREGIDIHSNDPQRPKTTVPIVGEVAPLFAFDLPLIALEMPFGEERAQEVHFVGTRIEQARPRLDAAAAPDSEIVALPARSGSPAGYRLRCLGRKVGTSAGNIVVVSGLDRPREIAIPYSCKVIGTLQVTPSNPFFNLKLSGSKAVRINVKSTQPDFEVRSVRVLEGPFAARFEHAEEGNSYRVEVTVLSDRIDEEARAVVGRLLIESSDRTEPHKEVPLFGSGRVSR
jgi:hypothetical protein